MSREEIVIGICDDDPEDVKQIRQEIKQCVKMLGEKEPIVIVYENGKNLLQYCRKQKIDLMFLDLEMPEWNGFELAERLYGQNPEIKIIFVSNHENMVFDSYEYTPLWFVRKSSIGRDMLKAMQKYYQIETKVQVRCKDRQGARDLWIYVNEVLYIEGSGHTILMQMANKECHQLYGSLKSLEERLSPLGFVRIHKNYLVNAKCVKEIGNRTALLWNGTELDIGKNRRKEIRELIEKRQQGRRLC